MTQRRFWFGIGLLSVMFPFFDGYAQIDPERRRLVQFGYNQSLEGQGPIAGYGFYYYNQPNFLRTNLTLRAAIAPVYVDTEWGFNQLLGPHTDLAFGLAGGGFADSYSEIRHGVYRKDESFTGHGAEISTSVYHLFNPDQLIPLTLVLRGSLRRTFYETDSQTDPHFSLPDDRNSFHVRGGLRWGGKEPTMTAPLAMELSVWYEGKLLGDGDSYGINDDRAITPTSHLFWSRGILRYTFDRSKQLFEFSLTAGTSHHADRFSAYRLGGVLPFASEFPLNIPGYYYQELSARRFVLLNGQYSFPLEPSKTFQGNIFAATGAVGYLGGLDQPGNWHSGAGAGITYKSPKGSWFVSLMYGHGFDAIRSHGRGANQVGIVFQYDFEAKSKWFDPGVSPYRSRGVERLFRE